MVQASMSMLPLKRIYRRYNISPDHPAIAAKAGSA